MGGENARRTCEKRQAQLWFENLIGRDRCGYMNVVGRLTMELFLVIGCRDIKGTDMN
jgi:hypothetical protein